VSTAQADWTTHTLKALADSGRRSSAPRAEVIEAIAELGCAVTAKEIEDHLRRRESGTGLASIYRTLELLDGMKLVQRCDVGEGVARYEPALPSGEHHHHLVCVRCGAVTPFEDPELELAIERVAGRVEHAVDAHDVTLRGECPDCRAGTARARR
jgi:Fur family ferric uptake transcriptional regulator